MKTKIILLGIILAFMVPITVFAESENNFKDGLLDSNLIDSNTLPKSLYDNRIITRIIIPREVKRTYKVKFKDPTNITGMYINSEIDGSGFSTSPPLLTLHFNNNTYRSYTLDGSKKQDYYALAGKDVISIDLKFDGGSFGLDIKEIDFFGGSLKDSDGDGIPDYKDEFPDDPTNTPEPTRPSELKEVNDLEIKSTDKQVDLSWKNPKKFFDKAKIYRKEVEPKMALNLNPFAPMKVHAESYKPLFETNGTEFSDLSIELKKEYEYKVTTNYKGMESNGVTVRAKVPKPPMADTREFKLPFGVEELLKSGNGLIALVGSFILLALAFIFVPKLVKLIRDSHSTQKGEGTAREPRIGRMPREARQSTRTPREPRAGRG